MESLIKKDILTKEELLSIDEYYEDNIEELVYLDNSIILRFIDLMDKEYGFSSVKMQLIFYLEDEALLCKDLFDEELIDEYLKNIELMKALELNYYNYCLALGNYYYYENNKKEALKYYEEAFKEGFSLDSNNYIYELERYLELSNLNKKEILINLINNNPSKDKISLDYVSTYILLISEIDVLDSSYLEYLNEATNIAKELVKEYKKDKDDYDWSDSDEERSLCELIALKFNYYVTRKEYKKAFKVYNELTLAIQESDCTRYYHARDKIYFDMIKLMSKEHHDLLFLLKMDNEIFEVLDIKDTLKDYVNKEITLKNKENKTYIFKVIKVKQDDVIIVPLLPIINEGAYLYMTQFNKDNKVYLKNKF